MLISHSPLKALLAGLSLVSAVAYAGEAGRIVFVAGEVQSGKRTVANGDVINEGDELSTGAQGYVYLKTVDNGLLILRPSSRARIVSYHVDNVSPANTQVKFELLSGVARNVSGDAVKLARQNFRFNTPVAAIGVRGTDFTVATDQDTSRVTVLSGAIVVSGFGGACAPGGSGPCEHAASRELSAGQVGQMLKVSKGQAQPQLLQAGSQAPDVASPPRPDEPVGKAGTSTSDATLDPQKADNLLHQVNTQKNTQVPPPAVLPPVTVPPVEPVVTEPAVQSTIVWGRWQPVLDRRANVDPVQLQKDGGEEIARNTYYVVSRSKGEVFQSPQEGSVGFALKQSEAMVYNEASKAQVSAGLENGKLNVDFGKATFATSFDLVAANERWKLQSQGVVSKDGVIIGDNQFIRPTNMNVNGVLSNENGGGAAYVFSSRLDANRVANGVTYWGK